MCSIWSAWDTGGKGGPCSLCAHEPVDGSRWHWFREIRGQGGSRFTVSRQQGEVLSPVFCSVLILFSRLLQSCLWVSLLKRKRCQSHAIGFSKGSRTPCVWPASCELLQRWMRHVSCSWALEILGRVLMESVVCCSWEQGTQQRPGSVTKRRWWVSGGGRGGKSGAAVRLAGLVMSSK